jgi:hypothetical protein
VLRERIELSASPLPREWAETRDTAEMAVFLAIFSQPRFVSSRQDTEHNANSKLKRCNSRAVPSQQKQPEDRSPNSVSVGHGVLDSRHRRLNPWSISIGRWYRQYFDIPDLRIVVEAAAVCRLPPIHQRLIPKSHSRGRRNGASAQPSRKDRAWRANSAGSSMLCPE